MLDGNWSEIRIPLAAPVLARGSVSRGRLVHGHRQPIQGGLVLGTNYIEIVEVGAGTSGDIQHGDVRGRPEVVCVGVGMC